MLREALRSARKRELEKKRKTLEKETTREKDDAPTLLPDTVENKDGDACPGPSAPTYEARTNVSMLESDFHRHETRMAEMAHAEILKFRENKIPRTGEIGQVKQQSDTFATENDIEFVGKADSFNPACDIEELESDSEYEDGKQMSKRDKGSYRGELRESSSCSLESGPSEEIGIVGATSVSVHGKDEDSQEVRLRRDDMLESPKTPKRRVTMMCECRDVHRYEKLNRISEGTYGVVYRGRDLETNAICALKRLKIDKEQSGFPLTSVREINILLALEHPNIVNVSEVVMGRKHTDPRDDQIFMVMEYADHDLSTVMQKRMKQPFTVAEVKCLMLQLLSGVAYLHENWVLHRDLKTANILYTNKGQLKICDFGLARQYSSFSKRYTQMVVTLWYRAPELLLGTREYSAAIDIWSVGCIMGELLTRKPLLPGKTEIDQLQKIYDLLGNPDETVYSEFPLWDKMRIVRQSKNPRDLQHVLEDHNIAEEMKKGNTFAPNRHSGIHLLQRLLDLNPKTRISAKEALNHPWFSSHPLPKDQEMMPTFKATNE